MSPGRTPGYRGDDPTHVLPDQVPFDVDRIPGAEVAQRFGIWVEKTNYGRKYMGVERTTIVIGKDGTIKKVFPKVSVDGHVEEVLAALD